VRQMVSRRMGRQIGMVHSFEQNVLHRLQRVAAARRLVGIDSQTRMLEFDTKKGMPHTSYLIPHTSYLIPHTSYLIPHTSYLILCIDDPTPVWSGLCSLLRF
jgi:hypothetical protein